MDKLTYVNPVTDTTNYYEDQKELIEKAKQVSENKLEQLIYFVSCLIHEGYEPEFIIKIMIPANRDVEIILPIIEDSDYFGYYVSWGDELYPEHNVSTHKYKKQDINKTYTIKFFGMNITGFGKSTVSTEDFQNYLISVVSFGILGYKFTSLSNAFITSANNFTVPNYLPSNITNISSMFSWCNRFNQPLNHWNTSNITNMENTFGCCFDFNQSLDNWDVSNVINMSSMFCYCFKFNSMLSNWNVSKVINMSSMFYSCNRFNQPLNNWDVSNVMNMNAMFYNCSDFSQILDDWNVSAITNVFCMFDKCDNFKAPFDKWNNKKIEL